MMLSSRSSVTKEYLLEESTLEQDPSSPLQSGSRPPGGQCVHLPGSSQPSLQCNTHWA